MGKGERLAFAIGAGHANRRAGPQGRSEIGATETVLTIAGGVALLLWGTRMVRTGVTRAFGVRLRRALAVGTDSRLRAFLTGIGVTALLQSSMATVLITSSFVAKKHIAAAGAVAVVLGADVGTTIVAQVLSLDLQLLIPLLLLGGVASFMTTEEGRPRHLGRVAIGLGLILLALQTILAAAAPLGESDELRLVLDPLTNDAVLVVIVAALLTWLTHSSLATVLLVMSLATAGVVDIPMALLLVVGANVGGAIAPIVITIRALPATRRIPLANGAMRLCGAAIAVPLLTVIEPALMQLDADPARLIVNFHTFFNVALAALFVPFAHLIGRATERALPDRPEDGEEQPRYLDFDMAHTPAVALANAARETLRMGDMVEKMLRLTVDALLQDNRQLAREASAMDDAVDRLNEAIKRFLANVSDDALSEQETNYYNDILIFATNLEHVGDIIDISLLDHANKKIKYQLRFSPEGLQEIRDFYASVQSNMQLAFNVFMTRDRMLARQLLDEKVAIRNAELEMSGSHFHRFREGRPETLQTSGLHLDIIRDLKRINGLISSVAYAILDQAGELETSRLRRRPGS